MGVGLTLLGGAVSGGNQVSSAVNRLMEHPILAYFLILSIFIIDGSVSFVLNWQGLIGTLFTLIINQLGIPIVVYSWQLMILFGILPIISFVLRASTNR